jgi:hypothetical protein
MKYIKITINKTIEYTLHWSSFVKFKLFELIFGNLFLPEFGLQL